MSETILFIHRNASHKNEAKISSHFHHRLFNEYHNTLQTHSKHKHNHRKLIFLQKESFLERRRRTFTKITKNKKVIGKKKKKIFFHFFFFFKTQNKKQKKKKKPKKKNCFE